MGCTSSKPQASAPVEKVEADPKQDEPAGTPFVKKAKQHNDPSIMMCCYFELTPDEFTPWKAKADAFYKAAKKTDDLLFYNMAFNEGGVHIQQGYRTATAMIAHLRHADKPMTDALKDHKLEKVEVFGPKRMLHKVKLEMTKIGDCYFKFYECSNVMKPIRKLTQFNGDAGSDKLVTCDISLKATQEEYDALINKLRAIHRRACDNVGSEAALVAYCVKEGMVKIRGCFQSMEYVLEHVACSVSHVDAELMHSLELYGPEAELSKLKALLNKAGGDMAAATAAVNKALADSLERAKSEALRVKASAAAAAKVAETKMSEKVQECRNAMCYGIDKLQEGAEEMAKEVYKTEMKVEGAVKETAKTVAKIAYKKAIAASNEIRASAQDAGIQLFEKTQQLADNVEAAIEKANNAAAAAANKAFDDIVEEEQAAAAAVQEAADYLKACAESAKDAAAATLTDCETELKACKLAVESGKNAVETACSDAAKDLLKQTCLMWAMVKQVAFDVVEGCYKTLKAGEKIAQELIDEVCEGARSACWSVVFAAESVFYVAYEHAVSCKKVVVDARDAAIAAAEKAGHKALELWRSTEKTALDAEKAAEQMVKNAEKAMEKAWTKTVTSAINMENSIRHSLYKKEVMLEEEISEVGLDIKYITLSVVKGLLDTYEAAEHGIMARIMAWHEAILEAEVKALKAIADAADSKAEGKVKTKSICC